MDNKKYERSNFDDEQVDDILKQLKQCDTIVKTTEAEPLNNPWRITWTYQQSKV